MKSQVLTSQKGNEWCKIEISENDDCASWEYQENIEDEETYIAGNLYFDNDVVIDYDGCYSLPSMVTELLDDVKIKYDL